MHTDPRHSHTSLPTNTHAPTFSPARTHYSCAHEQTHAHTHNLSNLRQTHNTLAPRTHGHLSVLWGLEETVHTHTHTCKWRALLSSSQTHTHSGTSRTTHTLTHPSRHSHRGSGSCGFTHTQHTHRTHTYTLRVPLTHAHFRPQTHTHARTYLCHLCVLLQDLVVADPDAVVGDGEAEHVVHERLRLRVEPGRPERLREQHVWCQQNNAWSHVKRRVNKHITCHVETRTQHVK